MNISIGRLGAVLFGIGEKHCTQHATILKTLKEIAIQQALNTDHIAVNTKQLEEGRIEFKDVNEAIAKINYNVAFLTGKSEQRRAEDKKDDDTDS